MATERSASKSLVLRLRGNPGKIHLVPNIGTCGVAAPKSFHEYLPAFPHHQKGTHAHTNKYLVLEVGEDGLIEGTSGWKLIEGEGGHDGEALSTGAEEKLIGAFVPSTGEIHLVEMSENGQIHGTMLDARRLRVVLVQPGEKPVASAYVLTKVEED